MPDWECEIPRILRGYHPPRAAAKSSFSSPLTALLSQMVRTQTVRVGKRAVQVFLFKVLEYVPILEVLGLLLADADWNQKLMLLSRAERNPRSHSFNSNEHFKGTLQCLDLNDKES